MNRHSYAHIVSDLKLVLHWTHVIIIHAIFTALSPDTPAAATLRGASGIREMRRKLAYVPFQLNPRESRMEYVLPHRT